MISAIFLKTILIFTLSLHAADAPPENATLTVPQEKFAAIVQYTKGKPSIIKDGKKTIVDFKDLIRFGETITVPKGARLKLITQKRCVAVLYDGTEVQAPTDNESPWQLIKGSARWICSEDKIERVVHQETEIDVKNGEFLFTNEKLIPFRDSIVFQKNILKKNTVYIFKNHEWAEDPNQPEEYELWKKDQHYPIPMESSRLSIAKPDDPRVTRVFIEGIPFGLSGVYNSYWEAKASSFNMDTSGFRLGTNFEWKNKSVLLFLDYVDSKTHGNNNQSMGPQPVGYKNIESEIFTLGIGLRHHHLDSASYYYYLGVSQIKYRFSINPDINESYNGKINYDFAVSGGLGYQKIFFSKSWLSFVVGAELRVTQTLTKGDFTFYNQNNNNNINPHGYLTSYNAILYFGPNLNF